MSAAAVRAVYTTVDTLWACVGASACNGSSESGHAGRSEAPALAVAAPTEEEKEKFTAWLAQMTAGVAADAGVSAQTVCEWICTAVQVRSKRSCTVLVSGIVADTGATVAGIGRRHISKAGETRQLKEGLQVSGAGGLTTVTETADLNLNGPLDGVMDNSLVFCECEESVLPVVPVCEEYDLGYQI